jgi:hypothetical protein
VHPQERGHRFRAVCEALATGVQKSSDAENLLKAEKL